MKRLVQLLAVSLGVALAGAAVAQPYYGAPAVQDQGRDPGLDWAQVVRVDPVIDTYEEAVPREVCRNVPVEYVEPRYAYQPGAPGAGTGGAVLGAIIGGALGNQVGKGDGRDAATIAGAVLGGSIGYNRAARGGYREVGSTVRQSSERVCETRVDYQRREQVVGYDVTYVYNGREYRTNTDAHPGDRIQVAVTVQPVF
jgi:uncharacterized protein YcfJ